MRTLKTEVEKGFHANNNWTWVNRSYTRERGNPVSWQQWVLCIERGYVEEFPCVQVPDCDLRQILQFQLATARTVRDHLVGENMLQDGFRQPGSALNLGIDNNMNNPKKSGGFIVDCVAYAQNGEQLEDLGGIKDPPVQPGRGVTYYVNLEDLTPFKVVCTFYWLGKNKSVVLYQEDNFKLQDLEIDWGVDESGFSLYDGVTKEFYLQSTW